MKNEELISLGEAVLNITMRDKVAVAKRAQGSFHIAQLLCHNLCVEAGITEAAVAEKPLTTQSMLLWKSHADLTSWFMTPAVEFAQGSKIQREGRASYLYMLKWLSESED